MEESIKKKAITTKEIKGNSIETILVGTEFIITNYHRNYSYCKGLAIFSIWNDEFKFLDREQFQ